MRVLEVYPECRKIRDIAFLDCHIALEYDIPLDDSKMLALRELFGRTGVTVEKKGKNGITQQDIIPMIKGVSTHLEDMHTIVVDTLICCQNPTLNPAQMILAVETYLPELRPDFSKCRRMEIYDINETVFR